jgi:hypothetical protein
VNFQASGVCKTAKYAFGKYMWSAQAYGNFISETINGIMQQ